MKFRTLLLLTVLTGTTAMHSQDKKTISANPFFNAYATPFQVPPFDLIKNEHFKPAILEGIRQQEEEIKKIVSVKKKAEFNNTIWPMENSGALLSRVSTVFNNLNSANTNEEIQSIAKELAPLFAAHNDNIYLNEELFQRVKYVWDNQNRKRLTKEQDMLLENTYKNFVRSGANLSAEGKKKLREINAALAISTLKSGQNILAETNSYELVISNKKDLDGLPAGLIETAYADAKARGKEGKWVFTLANSSVMPFLKYCDSRKLRKEIWTAYQMRANNGNANDNKELAVKIANLRGEKARLLGYESHADYVLEKSMAKKPETANKLLQDLWTPAVNMAKKEAEDIQILMKLENIKGDVQPYDWRYYTEKIRKVRFDLDEQEMKPYFSLEQTREGVFAVCKKLYGLKFKQLYTVPKYHEDVTVWEVTEAKGTHVGILYMDFHPRASKRGGAWMTSYRSQKTSKGKRVDPVVSIVCNFTKPTENAPALLTFDEVTTFFHEFGHALHGLLSNVTYESLSGTNVPRDFVELPSQIMENWAAEPQVMKMYAKHYDTGVVIPDALIQKMQKASTFDQGFITTEYLAASFLDMEYHSQKQAIKTDAETFEKQAMDKIGLPSSIIPRYRSTYFNHIFAGGYSAGYYSYIWSGVLDTDAFDVFKTNGLFNQKEASSFRKNILEKGGTQDPMELYKNFRGAAPSVKPLLKKRGLDKVQ
ncbi:M3 family metallopeptidase [Flavobacterium ardleyense]|uniref:M3 family metallopeptidase n=1 Tax=Flavobacterium ardleyense TaxID=2038737 RepID=A0ABW5Z9J8_9FLAO